MIAISWHLLRVPQLIPLITRLNSYPSTRLSKKIRRGNYHHRLFSYSYRWRSGEEEEELGQRHSPGRGFEDAVLLFNRREYFECHDVLESIWLQAEEPARTLVHAVLQCAVGFHHLLNQNHRGAMIELGEGISKLRKINCSSGPFRQFEEEMSAVLNFLYQTQLELAACIEDFCIAMDGSERSYQLLGSFAAGQLVYKLERDTDGILYIFFCPTELKDELKDDDKSTRIKVPTLHATEEHLKNI